MISINSYFVEQSTRASQRPDKPHFTWETFSKENGYSNVRIHWHPNHNGNPGNHFFVKYKLKGETISRQTSEEYLTNQIEVSLLMYRNVKLLLETHSNISLR